MEWEDREQGTECAWGAVSERHDSPSCILPLTHPHGSPHHTSPLTHTPPSHHNPQVKNGNTYLTPYLASTVQSVERKLIFIPIIFILLRIWSLLFTIIDIEAPGKLSCPAVEFFLHMGVRVEGCEI